MEGLAGGFTQTPGASRPNLQPPARSSVLFSDRNSHSNYSVGGLWRLAGAERVLLAWAAAHTPPPPHTAPESAPPASHHAAAPPEPRLHEAQCRSPFFGSGRPWTE